MHRYYGDGRTRGRAERARRSGLGAAYGCLIAVCFTAGLSSQLREVRAYDGPVSLAVPDPEPVLFELAGGVA